jgi:hypothetical protein
MIPISDRFTGVHKPGVSNSGTKIAITPFDTCTRKRLGFSGSLLPQGAGFGYFGGQFFDPCHDSALLGQGWHEDFQGEKAGFLQTHSIRGALAGPFAQFNEIRRFT